MTEPTRAEVEIEVRYAETDQMGIVHHATYLVWFELARTSLCARSGYHYADIEKLGYLLMVTGAELNYRRSARYGDTVLVTCWIDRLGSRGLNFGYEVVLDGQVLTTGRTRHVWVEVAKNRPCRIPEPLRVPFERLVSGAV